VRGKDCSFYFRFPALTPSRFLERVASQSAVDRKDGAGDVTGDGRGEENSETRQFFRFAIAADGDFLCGLGGALLSALLVPVVGDQLVVGASGAVLGVAVAFAWYWPDTPVLVFPFPEPFAAKWLVIFTVGISLVLAWLSAATGASDGVSHLAHLGGIGTALLLLKTADWRSAHHEQRLRRTSVPSAVVSSAALVARSSDPGQRPDGGDRRRPVDRTQAEIDRVLDKISANGITSLTPAERKFLAEMSRRMRDQT